PVRQPHLRSLRPARRVLVHRDLARPLHPLPERQRPHAHTTQREYHYRSRAQQHAGGRAVRPHSPSTLVPRRLSPRRLAPPPHLLPRRLHVPHRLRPPRQFPRPPQRREQLGSPGLRRHPRPHLRRLLRRTTPGHV